MRASLAAKLKKERELFDPNGPKGMAPKGLAALLGKRKLPVVSHRKHGYRGVH